MNVNHKRAETMLYNAMNELDQAVTEARDLDANGRAVYTAHDLRTAFGALEAFAVTLPRWDLTTDLSHFNTNEHDQRHISGRISSRLHDNRDPTRWGWWQFIRQGAFFPQQAVTAEAANYQAQAVRAAALRNPPRPATPSPPPSP
jgi:hypothetical protein